MNTLAGSRTPGSGKIGFGGDDPGGYGWEDDLPPGTGRRIYRTGMLVGLISITMMFVAFTSAYVVRKDVSNDWRPIELPRLLWLNAGLLLLSSVTMEKARKALQRGWRAACNGWLALTTFLGVTFVVGQLVAWKELSAHGIHLATNPSSSFFYLLTAAHGVHLCGGLLALLYLDVAAWRYRLGPAKRTLIEVTSMYWHFMDGLWLYILCLVWFLR